MNFKNKTLENIFRSFEWGRNNTILLFEDAVKSGQLDYKPNTSTQHSVLYQFQCIVTTTDARIRKLSNDPNTKFGILIKQNETILKEDIETEEVKELLVEGTTKLEDLLKDFDVLKTEENILAIQSLINHEYLHQGQLIVLFREAGVDFPQRFKEAWDL